MIETYSVEDQTTELPDVCQVSREIYRIGHNNYVELLRMTSYISKLYFGTNLMARYRV